MMEIIGALLGIGKALIELYSVPIFTMSLLLGMVAPAFIKYAKSG